MKTDTIIQSNQHSDNQISWELFQEKYLIREDDYKYEWVNGAVQQISKPMNSKQFIIQHTLLELLYRLKAQNNHNWQLIAEGDAFFNGNHRRPDLLFTQRNKFKRLQQVKMLFQNF